MTNMCNTAEGGTTGSMYIPKAGEEVEVVLRGEATYPRLDGSFNMGRTPGGFMRNTINPDDDHVKSIRLIEPVVETFVDGDVIRFKKAVYAGKREAGVVCEGGTKRILIEGRYKGKTRTNSRYTSKDFERVELP